MDSINRLIVQHNNLIEAKFDLSLQEMRLFYMAAAQVPKNAEELERYEVQVADFARAIGRSDGGLYTELKKTADSITGHSITVERINHDGKRQFVSFPIMADVAYTEGDSTIGVRFHPRLQPYLTELKNDFTSAQLLSITRLKSPYAIRLYWMCKRYEGWGRVTRKVEDLREKLSLEAKYERYGDLKRRVIVPSLEEINEKTDISVSMRERKAGRKVAGLVFTVRPDQKQLFPQSGNNDRSLTEKDANKRRQILESLSEERYGDLRERALDELDDEILGSEEVSETIFERVVETKMVELIREDVVQ